jgi:serine/threonine-protein kinase RsbW
MSSFKVRTIKYPARYESLNDVRKFAAEAAEAAGLNEADVYAVQMAIDEAFTNIIEHAFGGECDEEIECNCLVEGDSLTIILRDCGASFDPEKVPDPNLEGPLEEREVGGLGLFFIRKLMDEVTFSFQTGSGSEGGCNILKMVKRKEKKR